jgi:hypothetical protein
MGTMFEPGEIAKGLRRGVTRLLMQQGFAALAEVSLANGRRADLMALGRDGEIRIIEIKSSLADFRADQKWPEYRDYCDRFYFAIPHDFPDEIIPAEAGLILADSYGAEIQRHAPEHRLAPARRRAVLLRFAQVAADRLHGLSDPDSGFGGT